MKNNKIIFLIIAISLVTSLFGCKKNDIDEKKEIISSNIKEEKNSKSIKPIVTFIELGSVKCVPCKMMVPVMEKVQEKYKDQVDVLFYDVWTAEGQPYGKQYGISVIPTQIFLDADGNEYFRHSGFFPFEELEKILLQKGVK